MTSQLDRVSNLYFGSPGNPLEVRVLPRWTFHFRKNVLWFIVVDKYGEVIQLLEEKENQAHAESKLSLGQWYRITDYTCTTPDNYKVSAILTDITDSATIFMTDEAARALTNISSQDIINMYPNEDMKKLPPPLQKSKGSTKNVYIQCKNPSSANNIRFAITSTTNIGSTKSTLTSSANVMYQ
ncbi:unnamed protein product [Lactuca saligna]|uniref:Uncharacterized protein n=1 Tax=Lactuca saligna TaxID=75948 RepID=A0AA35YQA8_LACSI|nr:unnamed protein product [Lactuca saligna]